MIDRSRDGFSISCDGTRAQNAEVAAWYRSLLPPDFPRLITDDMGWGWHVDLVHGITAEQFVTSIVDHDVPGWTDNDPDLA